jgi:hypothetical protein
MSDKRILSLTDDLRSHSGVFHSKLKESIRMAENLGKNCILGATIPC